MRPRRPAKPRSPSRPPAPRREIPGGPPLYATTLRGLEPVLEEEIRLLLAAEQVEPDRGRVAFLVPGRLPLPVPLLTCEAAGLLVRAAQDDFGGTGGLTVLREKLARTEFARVLEAREALGLPPPRTFSVSASVARNCGFRFFDAKREATHAVARRAGLSPVETAPDIVVDVDCYREALYIGVRLPLAEPQTPTTLDSPPVPRSVLGAVLRLAAPRPRLTVLDPDCGAGHLLATWRLGAGNGRRIGLSYRRDDPALPGTVGRHVRGSPRAWPIADGRLSRVVSVLPRVRSAAEFARLLLEVERCLAPGGLAVFAIPGAEAFDLAIESLPHLVRERECRFRSGETVGRVVVLVRSRPAGSHRARSTAGDRARASLSMGGVAGRRQAKSRAAASEPTGPRPAGRRGKAPEERGRRRADRPHRKPARRDTREERPGREGRRPRQERPTRRDAAPREGRGRAESDRRRSKRELPHERRPRPPAGGRRNPRKGRDRPSGKRGSGNQT